jgi:bacterioferritin-associated ferredoxin
MYGYEAPDVSNREGVWRPVPEDEAREAVIAAARSSIGATCCASCQEKARLIVVAALDRLDALDAS